MENVFVKSDVYPISIIFSEKYDVDFYQREYVWQKKQIEDLIEDLTNEFLKNWHDGDPLQKVDTYSPYYMGEIVLSVKGGSRSAIIDGQQRITTITLLLMFLLRKFGHVSKFPTDIAKLIYSDYYGQQLFNLDIDERKVCMMSLFENGTYTPKDTDSISVCNLVGRYEDIEECWRDEINDSNIVWFMYWLKEKIMFSKVWTNSDEFAYVIFETMNDRGLSLTQVEMLRSYLLANVDSCSRDVAMKAIDSVIKRLTAINLTSKSKAEFEFFKIYFRSHYAEEMSQSKNSSSDFVRIGKEFHRWVRDNAETLGLKTSKDYVDFIDRIQYFATKYEYIMDLIDKRDTENNLFLVVNADYGFTLQPALIISAISYNDSDEIVNQKIQIISKYLTKVLSWRVWNHWLISQNQMESKIYDLCKLIRNKSVDELKDFLKTYQMDDNSIDDNTPVLNQQNRPKIKVLLSLITEIVARHSGTSDYMLNKKEIEVEHIWSNHFEEHTDEFSDPAEFANVRNSIGDLLVLPKSFNASYGDDEYKDKVKHYYEQNILAQTLNPQKYENNPGFIAFMNSSEIDFKPYDDFKRKTITERAELYRQILKYELVEK